MKGILGTRGLVTLRNVEGGPIEWSPKIKALVEWGAPQLLQRLHLQKAPDDVGVLLETRAKVDGQIVPAVSCSWMALAEIRRLCRAKGKLFATIEMEDPGEGMIRFVAETLDGEVVAGRVPLASVRIVDPKQGGSA